MPHVAESIFAGGQRLRSAGMAAEGRCEIPDGVHDSAADIEGQKRMLIFRPEVTYPWFPTVADGRYAGILL